MFSYMHLQVKMQVFKSLIKQHAMNTHMRLEHIFTHTL